MSIGRKRLLQRGPCALPLIVGIAMVTQAEFQPRQPIDIPIAVNWRCQYDDSHYASAHR